MYKKQFFLSLTILDRKYYINFYFLVMNLEQPYLPSNNNIMSPQNMNQPRFVSHQMGPGQAYVGSNQPIQQPPPLVSHSAQQFGFGGAMRGGGYMSQAPPQQQIPEHLMPALGQQQQQQQHQQQFEHPSTHPPQGVPMNRGGNGGGQMMGGGIPGVPNHNHRNVPQNMLKSQPMVNHNMPGYTPQIFNQIGSNSPLGASVGNNHRNMGPIGNSQSVDFQGGIGQGLPRGGSPTRGWGGDQGNRADGWGGNDGGVVQNYPGSGAFRGALHNPNQINDPRQMINSFDQKRQSLPNNTSKTAINYVGFNAQGEKVYDAQYYQNTPGRHDTTEFYAQYKKTPSQQLTPSNSDKNNDSFMGYEPPVSNQQAQTQAQEYAIRNTAGRNPGNLMKAPLNQRNLRNFMGKGNQFKQDRRDIKHNIGRGTQRSTQGGNVPR